MTTLDKRLLSLEAAAGSDSGPGYVVIRPLVSPGSIGRPMNSARCGDNTWRRLATESGEAFEARVIAAVRQSDPAKRCHLISMRSEDGANAKA
jgi:hypothetical protein